MKSTNKKRLFIGTAITSVICIITFAILVITLIGSFLQQEKGHIQDKVITLFKESVNEDFQNRSKILTEEISTGETSVENFHETNRDSSSLKSST